MKKALPIAVVVLFALLVWWATPPSRAPSPPTHPDPAVIPAPNGENTAFRPEAPGFEKTVAPPENAGFVTGRVLFDQTLDPVPGIPVHARPHWPTVGKPVSGTSSVLGEFRLALPPGTWTLAAWGDGRLPAELAAPTVARDSLVAQIETGRTVHRDLLVTRGGRIRGRVLRPGNSPVTGARVRLRFSRLLERSGLRRSPIEETTGLDGRFDLSPVPPGAHLRVVGYAPDGLVGISRPVLVPAGGDAEVDVRLPEGRYVRVRVVTKESKAPVTGATLVARWTPARHLHVASQRVFRTNASGTVRIGPLPPVPVWFRVEAPGRSRHLQGTPRADPEDTDVVIELPAADRLAGRVIFPDGAPLKSGRLEIHCVSEAGGSTGFSDLDPLLDADGRFVVEGVPRGRVRIERDAVRDGKRYRLEFDTHSGEEELELTLEPYADGSDESVDVLVVDPRGAAVPLGRWNPGWRHRSGGSRYDNGLIRDADLDRSRQVRLEVFDARGERGDPLPCGAVFAGPFSVDHGPIVVELPPERTVTGTVVGPREEPVAGATLAFRAVRPAIDDEPAEPGAIHEEAVSGADGRFRAGRLGDGPYVVHVTPPPAYGPGEEVPVVAGARDVRIGLPAARRIRVTVLDWKGEPVPVVTVEARLPEDPDRSIPGAAGRTDVDGVVVLPDLTSAETLLVVAFAPPERKDLVPGVRAEWRKGDLTLEFARLRALKLRIVDGEGQLVSNARVFYRAAGASAWTSARADSRGRLLLRVAGHGRFQLRFSAEHGDPADPGSTEIELAATDEEEAVRIDRGGRFRLQVTGWPRGYRGNLLIEAGGHVRFFPALLGPDGRVDLDGLRFPCTILVRPNGPRIDPRCVILSAAAPSWPEARSVPLAPGLAITGRVIPASPGVAIFAMVLGEYHYAGIDAEGRYRIFGLPEGTWTVTAKAGDIVRETRVAAGSTADFDLR